MYDELFYYIKLLMLFIYKYKTKNTDLIKKKKK